MQPGSDKTRSLALVLVAFVAAVFVFASPFYLLWMAPTTLKRTVESAEVLSTRALISLLGGSGSHSI